MFGCRVLQSNDLSQPAAALLMWLPARMYSLWWVPGMIRVWMIRDTCFAWYDQLFLALLVRCFARIASECCFQLKRHLQPQVYSNNATHVRSRIN
jgi:hypothetical protein